MAIHLSHYRWAFLGLFWVALLLLLAGGLRPEPLPFTHPPWDKWFHFLGFFSVTLCLSAAAPKRFWWLVVPSLVVLGAFVEFYQLWFLSARTFSLGDLVANSAGVTVGWLSVWWLYRVNMNVLTSEVE